MTALLNRTAFNRDVRAIKENAGEYKSVTLALFDLNHLKRINDTKGHLAGDQVIVRFADYLHGVFGETAWSYRIGGDEFAVLIYNMEKEETEALIDRLKKRALPEIEYAWGFERCEIADGEEIDMDKLFSAADRKMYLEKEKSRKSRSRGNS